MSNAKNINEVSIITTVDSGDYVMVSDISDDSLKRATVSKVGEKLLGTTDISACSTEGTVTGGIKAACDGVDELDASKVNKAGDTMTGNLAIVNPNAQARLSIGSADSTRLCILDIYSNTGYGAQIYPLAGFTANRVIRIPNANGTLALTSDINEMNTKLSNKKMATIYFETISPNNYVTIDYTVSSAATYGIIAGYIIQSSVELALMQIYMPDNSTISVRVRNFSSGNVSGASIAVYYI